MIYLIGEKTSEKLPDNVKRVPLPNTIRPSTELLNWFYEMADKDAEVVGELKSRYIKELNENPVQHVLETIQEESNGQDVFLVYNEDFAEVKLEATLKAYAKKMGVLLNTLDINAFIFQLDPKESKKIRDLFVKLSNVYRNDLYIFGLRYVYPGKKSFGRLNGKVVCILNDEYVSLLEKVFGRQDVRIANIRVFKDDFGAFDPFPNSTERSDCVKLATDVSNGLETSWDFKFSENETEHAELVERFLDTNLICRLKDPKMECPDVMLGASMIPCCSAKTIDKILYRMDYFTTVDEQKIYQLLMELQFTHFRILMQYFYI